MTERRNALGTTSQLASDLGAVAGLPYPEAVLAAKALRDLGWKKEEPATPPELRDALAEAREQYPEFMALIERREERA